MIKLEDLEVESYVAGLEPSEPVLVIYVKHTGEGSCTVKYDLPDGTTRGKTLFRDDETKLSLVSATRTWTFDAKPEAFKLAAEAMRIQLAHLFDPMMAVHTSDVEPLPHQVSAVYEALLPRQPLRFVLADDPGAGKTIMAGLFIRELELRGDLERCLIIAPGSLIEQWQTELSTKFGLRFEILSHALVESTATGNPFLEHPRLIAKLDQLSRNEDWLEKLDADGARWDLVIVDEAHKMSASYKLGNDLGTTKRYDLGKKIGSPERTRNFLLMTATPHNGKEEDFQAWLCLVDPDRFYGKAKTQVGPTDLKDLMRRMVKEELLKFDGTKLFPPRIASTLKYALSPPEMDLYEAVTTYVRDQMGRAEQLHGKKRGMVGFALTILQRRVASSPHAIYRSLERRRKRLEARLEEMKSPARATKDRELDERDYDEDDLTAEERERIENELVDTATSAATIPELASEITVLRGLERDAAKVIDKKVDKKWDELSKLLQSKDAEMFLPGGRRRKMIVFTEHRDTLEYLMKEVAGVLGDPEAVVEIHGGTRRADRLEAQDKFRQDPKVLVLVATDAAGEGVNLQVANLLVNYDLPWNPNRLEQRFGRIHRIGQRDTCHMWNLVAHETREGAVFERLFAKIEEERKALGGKVFDVLGKSFEETPLPELLIQAIRLSELPEEKQKLLEKVDCALAHEHLKEVIRENALTDGLFSQEDLYRVREEMEKAEARKLQPFYLRKFVIEALGRHGGELREREPDRYEIKHVPATVRKQHSLTGGTRRTVLERYERITFDRTRIDLLHKPRADLVHPAHPLMAALIALVQQSDGVALNTGTVLVDPTDPGVVPRLLFVLDHTIRDATPKPTPASRRMELVEIDANGIVRPAGAAPYLGYGPVPDTARAVVDAQLAEPWLAGDLSTRALEWASANLVRRHLDDVTAQRQAMVDKTLAAVHERLTKEINHWAKRANELAVEVKAGKQPAMQPENALRRKDELKARLVARTRDLEAQRELASNPPTVAGCALILPQGLLDRAAGKTLSPMADQAARQEVERIAMAAVEKAEIALGHSVKDVSKEKCGWDLTSTPTSGISRHIEVKGRYALAETFTVTANEVLEALNQGDKFLLAIVTVDGDVVEAPVYIRTPFTKELEAVSANYSLAQYLARGKSAKDV
jgi:superfamily II DNA or RNA helicase